MPTQRNPRAGQSVQDISAQGLTAAEHTAAEHTAAEYIRSRGNQLSADTVPPSERTELSKNIQAGDMCSSGAVEPLPGTAKAGKVVLALEHFGGWGRDILDGEALGEELTAKIQAFLKENGAQLQFIRKPGKAGQERKNLSARSLYISWCTGTDNTTPQSVPQPIMEYLEVGGPEDLLTLDLSTPGHTPGATRVAESILLVCTHGKRDRCCAVFGRPVATELAEKYNNVWESSHTKGHRFAPSMILLPSNYSYGHLTTEQAANVLDAAAHSRLALTGNRGNGIYDAPSQVAELAVLNQLAANDTPLPTLTIYRPHEELPAHLAGKPKKKEKGTTTRTVIQTAGQVGTQASVLDGAQGTELHNTELHNTELQSTAQQRTWTVRLEQQVVGPVMSSCGDNTKDATVWVASEVIEK